MVDPEAHGTAVVDELMSEESHKECDLPPPVVYERTSVGSDFNFPNQKIMRTSGIKMINADDFLNRFNTKKDLDSYLRVEGKFLSPIPYRVRGQISTEMQALQQRFP